MCIGVKYCGGCNPRYDRAALVQRLKSELGGDIRWVYAGRTEEPMDFVLVVCGCTAACAAHQDLQGRSGKTVIFAQDQYEAARGRILSMMNQ